jgi:hypothetical protein
VGAKSCDERRAALLGELYFPASGEDRLEVVAPPAVESSGALRMINGVNKELRGMREFGLANAATQHAKGLAYQMRRAWQKLQPKPGKHLGLTEQS